MLLGNEVPLPRPERLHYGRGARCLDACQHGDPVDPSQGTPLLEGLVHRPDVGGVAHWEDDAVRDLEVQLVHYLEGHGLLPLRAVGVDAVEQVQLPLPGQLLHHRQSVVEVAVHHDHLGAVEHGLRQLPGGDLPRGQEHHAPQPPLGGVGRQGRGGVTGGGAPHGPAAQLQGSGHAHGHAAVLEGAGGVGALVLDVQPLYTGLPDEVLAVVQRCAALLQGDGLAGVHREEGGVAPDPQGPLPEVVRPYPGRSVQVHLYGQQAPALGAGVLKGVLHVRAALETSNLMHLTPSCIRLPRWSPRYRCLSRDGRTRPAPPRRSPCPPFDPYRTRR
ncbi:MAG: hypothetical protein A4E31_00677 [Methanomassiliicoccales archaeon PtaU1.Bin030]|nr:MAG: hypothetical protein A4E31_00677 [Methanomassiliicoccales archaeon PtaU1.Bin030]